MQMLEQWYELQEFDRLPDNEGPTLAQLEAIGIQVGIPVKTAAEWYALRKQKSLLAARRASEYANSAKVAAATQQQPLAKETTNTQPVPQQAQASYQPPPQSQSTQQQRPIQQKRTVRKNAPKEAPGWTSDSNRANSKLTSSKKFVLGHCLDENSGYQQNASNLSSGSGSSKPNGSQAQLEKWFVSHKTGFPSGKEIDRLMKMTSKSREFIVEWCKNRRRTKVEKMQTCLVSDIQTAILEHWFVTNRSAISGKNINRPLLTNR